MDYSQWFDTNLLCPKCNKYNLKASPSCKTIYPCIHGGRCPDPECDYQVQLRGSGIDAPEDNPCYPFFYTSAEVFEATDRACNCCRGKRYRYLLNRVATRVPCWVCREQQYKAFMEDMRQKQIDKV
jgi:hypothetical protein